jgi:hypothetical protein
LGLAICASVAGCKKNSSNEVLPNNSVPVGIKAIDVKPDGTLTDAAIKQIQAEAQSGKPLTVRFVRTSLSDAGLEQLGQFKNLRRLEVYGARITPGGIEKLKKAVPEVEVLK